MIELDRKKASGYSFLINQFDDKSNWEGHLSILAKIFFGALLGNIVSGLNPSIIDKARTPLGIFTLVIINLSFIVTRPKVVAKTDYVAYLVALSLIVTTGVWLSVKLANQLDDRIFNRDDDSDDDE